MEENLIELAPILLFVYNRPDHTKITIDALLSNFLSSESELHIYSDGPKDESAQEKVNEVREVINKVVGFKKVVIHNSIQNKGLANSIIGGATEILATHEKVIILEDDIVTSKYFLQYMNNALECYKNEEKVMHVSGYMFPVDQNNLEETFFLKQTNCWGWGTWKNSWEKFQKNPSHLINTFDSNMIRDFNVDGAYNYFSQVTANYEKKINTWAIFWYASVFLNNGLSVNPRNSLCKNIGMDGSGVHCDSSDTYDVKLIDSEVKVNYQPLLLESVVARNKVREYFLKQKPSVLRRVLNKVKKICNKYNSRTKI